MFTSDSGLINEKDVLAYLGPTKFATMNQLMVSQNQRAGQAFFNVLTPEDQEKLRGTFVDPFHKQYYPAVLNALEFLLEN